ncbi:MAG: hypothetical protein ACR2M1_04685 [Gemmatimonadaceae bacterium]
MRPFLQWRCLALVEGIFELRTKLAQAGWVAYEREAEIPLVAECAGIPTEWLRKSRREPLRLPHYVSPPVPREHVVLTHPSRPLTLIAGRVFTQDWDEDDALAFDFALVSRRGAEKPLFAEATNTAAQIGGEAIPGWFYEDLGRNDIGGGPSSPNGKMLREPEIRAACQRLLDDNYRAHIRSIASLPDGGAASSEVTSADIRALRQGLWLEYLVQQRVVRWASEIRVGWMIGPHELDVIALICGHRLAFECKDGSLGQNAYVIAERKAAAFDAMSVALVSTRPYHANVRHAIESAQARAEYLSEFGRPVYLVSSNKAEELVDQLDTTIADQVQRAFLGWAWGAAFWRRLPLPPTLIQADFRPVE